MITGGTGGLGTALVRRSAAPGLPPGRVYLLPEEAERFEQRVRSRRRPAHPAPGRCHQPRGSQRLHEGDRRRSSAQINVVCALVGGWAGGRDVEDTDDVRFERMLDLNLRSAFYAARAALPYLRRPAGDACCWSAAGPRSTPRAARPPSTSPRPASSPWARPSPRNSTAPRSPATSCSPR